MPTIEVEVGEDGKFGTLPEALQTFVNNEIARERKKASEKARAEIESARAAKPDPVEVEKAKALEMEVSKLKEAEALREKNYEAAAKLREERYQAELSEREKAKAALEAEVARRTGRIEEMARRDIRAAALAAGARRESLDELELILGSSIGLDDALQAFVKDAKDAGKPRLDKDGKPVSVEGFVTQYLTDHPHHKAAPQGRGGGARGGQSFTSPGATSEKAAILDEIAKNPTVANVASAFSRIGKA